MLNFDVKRKINALRDILVGKVPDPKAQVEQITIALIYKFMDDMDLEGMEFGASREFFKEDYEKYAWSNIMQPENSGQQRSNLYAEGIDKMSGNPHLPQLFREIFKGAYVPYRDPETLNMFLKEINDFTYDHSEELGNAFEYLLSIMGSQGDAGQFRTPRHIIDMIVEIVDPQKTDSILDPACGTAGFLISSYKHILVKNRDKDGNSTLSADDRKRMTKNFAGYDISPDMVRLSRVNMYLHKFAKPKISEYDTLTLLDKWDETFDVILANPPFMTPKGGIMPHSRFAVKSSKSEVLFVDYILEHLNINGKAGIIVPEGIISNDFSANVQLRKNMVNAGLYAVIGLHQFVFKPYAGVSTFLLLFDKAYKQKDKIYIYNLENDGFEKSEGRLQTDLNDIPESIREILYVKEALLNCDEKALIDSTLKGKIITPDDYGDEFDFHPNSYFCDSGFNKISIEKIFNICKGTLQSTKRIDGEYDFITAADDWGKHESYTHDTEALIFVHGAGGSLGKVHYVNGKFITSDLCFVLTPKDGVKADLKYYYAYFNANRKRIVKLLARGANKKAISKTRFEKFEIEDIPYDRQKEIGSSVSEKLDRISILKQNIEDEYESMKSLVKAH